MLFCIGPLDVVLEAQSPYLALFQNTGSSAAATALLVILFILISLGNITALATTSREMWAFSRDKGFPFSRWISKVKIPIPSSSLDSLPLIHQYQLTHKPDEPQTSSPRQLRLPHLNNRWHPLPNQPGLHLRVQHNRLPNPPRPSLHLHDLNRVRSAQASPRRTAPARPLVPRPLRHPHQYVRLLLLRFRYGVCVFPVQLARRYEFG